MPGPGLTDHLTGRIQAWLSECRRMSHCSPETTTGRLGSLGWQPRARTARRLRVPRALRAATRARHEHGRLCPRWPPPSGRPASARGNVEASRPLLLVRKGWWGAARFRRIHWWAADRGPARRPRIRCWRQRGDRSASLGAPDVFHPLLHPLDQRGLALKLGGQADDRG